MRHLSYYYQLLSNFQYITKFCNFLKFPKFLKKCCLFVGLVHANCIYVSYLIFAVSRICINGMATLWLGIKGRQIFRIFNSVLLCHLMYQYLSIKLLGKKILKINFERLAFCNRSTSVNFDLYPQSTHYRIL